MKSPRDTGGLLIFLGEVLFIGFMFTVGVADWEIRGEHVLMQMLSVTLLVGSIALIVAGVKKRKQ